MHFLITAGGTRENIHPVRFVVDDNVGNAENFGGQLVLILLDKEDNTFPQRFASG